MYRWTVLLQTRMPSLSSSPRRRSAPQSGLLVAISRISAARAVGGRTRRPRASAPEGATACLVPAEDCRRLDEQRGVAPRRCHACCEPHREALPRCPQRVPTHGAVPALEPTQKAALHTPRLCQDELLEHLRMPALLGRHPRARGLWLGDVIVLVCLLACGDGGEDQIGSKPSRDPTEHAAPPRWSAGANLDSGEAQLVLPERDVLLLHPGKRAIDSGQSGVG